MISDLEDSIIDKQSRGTGEGKNKIEDRLREL